MSDPEATATFTGIPVELTFLAGQTSLTVGELQGLAPGYTFELPAPVGSDLTICANGKPVGRGQLIELGDHLGVRVTAFSSL